MNSNIVYNAMYRNRGRPDDTKNIEALAIKQSLTDVVLVDQLQSRRSFGCIPTEELKRRGKHFQEFRTTIPDQKLPRHVTNLVFLPPSKTAQENGRSRTLNKKQFINVVTNKPIINKSYQQNTLPQHFDQPGEYKRTVKEVKKLHNSSAKFEFTLQKELESTKEQINEASVQLAQIQKILKMRKDVPKTKLDTVLEDKEAEEIETAQTVNHYNRGISRQTKLLDTLSKLNKKLADMQNRYFNEHKIKYKSIKDRIFETNLQSTNNLKTIFENRVYEDPSTESVSYEAQNLSDPQIKLQFDRRDNIRTVYKVKRSYDSASTIEPQYEFSTNISSDNYLFNRNRVKKTYKYLDRHDPVENMEDILDNGNSFDEIISSQQNAVGDFSIDTKNKIDSSVETCDRLKSVINFNKKDREKMMNVLGWKHNLLQSDYLMKEFDLNAKEMTLNIAKASSKPNNSTSNDNLHRSSLKDVYESVTSQKKPFVESIYY